MIIIGCLILLLLPLSLAGYGKAVTWKARREDGWNIASRYIIGCFCMLSIFTVFSILFTIADRPFHELAYVLTALYAGGLFLYFAAVWRCKGFQRFASYIRTIKEIIKIYWWIIVPAAVILFQIIRAVVMTNSVYSDDKYYITRINDMLYLDRILATDDRTGVLLASARMSNPKFVLSSWLQFLAAVCSMTKIHPLILVKTIFPVFMISLHYLIIWELTYYLSRETRNRVLVMLFYALLMEFGSVSLRTDYSYYLFTWSWYGKTFYQFAVIPAVLLFFLKIREHTTGWRDGIILMLLCIAGIGSSTTALMLLPVELLVLIFFECLSKKTVRELWISVPAFGPIGIGVLMYFVMF